MDFPAIRQRHGALALAAFFVTAMCGGAQAAVLDLVRSAPAGSWIHASQNAVSSVWTPGPDQNDFTVMGGEMNRIIYAWSSFAWDSNRSDMIIYGGGHANYGGNDVYTWNGSNLLWERSSLPSRVDLTLVGGYFYGFAADGAMNAPQSAHTYDNTVFLKTSDRYLTFGGAAFNNGGQYFKANGDGTVSQTGPYVFTPNLADPFKVGGTTGSGVNPARLGSQAWQNRDTNTTAPPGQKPISFVDGFSDSTVVGGKDVVYVGGTQFGTPLDLYRYTINDINNPTADTWQLVGTATIGTSEGNAAGALDIHRNVFVRTGETGLPFIYWDTSQSGAGNVDHAIFPTDLTGGLMPTDTSGYGLIYDQARHRFIFWKGGTDVFALNEPAGAIGVSGWTVTKLNVNLPGGPGPLNTIQILGKWQYATDLDAFVGLQGATTGDVWIFKPEGWIDPAAAVPEPQTAILSLLGLLVVGSRVHARRRSLVKQASV